MKKFIESQHTHISESVQESGNKLYDLLSLSNYRKLSGLFASISGIFNDASGANMFVAFALSGGASRSVCLMHAFNIDSRGDQQLTQIARDRRLRAQSLQDSCTSGDRSVQRFAS